MERRDFIRIVTSIGASGTLLATLATRAMDGKPVLGAEEATLVGGELYSPQGVAAGAVAEKISVSNNGTNLVLDVSGKPGRSVVILYKLADKKGVEHIFVHKIDRIKKTGVAGFVIDMAQSLNADIPFMVVTSATPRLEIDNRGTDWFTVRLNSGQTASARPAQNYATDPEGEHQKVVRYAADHIQRRSFAPLKRF